MRYLFLLLAVVAFANAANWASIQEWSHAALTACLGGVCYLIALRTG